MGYAGQLLGQLKVVLVACLRFFGLIAYLNPPVRSFTACERNRTLQTSESAKRFHSVNLSLIARTKLTVKDEG
jgi:hypothetical protein